MKRGNVALASVGFVVAALVIAPRCGSPQGHGSGDRSVAMPFATATTPIYSTRFDATENPISENGLWINGKQIGRDWNDVRTVPGKAYGADFVGLTSRYNDPIAHLSRSSLPFDADQYATATVARAPDYNNPSDKHEVELLLRFRITPHHARGYEVLWGQDGEIAIIRWNGPLGDYTKLGGLPAPGPGPAVDGDRLHAEILGSTVQVYRNGEFVVAAADPASTWTDGQPGIGFWPTPGATLASYGWTTFEAGHVTRTDLPPPPE